MSKQSKVKRDRLAGLTLTHDQMDRVVGGWSWTDTSSATPVSSGSTWLLTWSIPPTI